MLRAEPSLRLTRRRTIWATWFDHGVIALAFALLLTGFRTTIQGSDWWITTVLVATLTGVTCAVLRAIGVTRWVAPIALAVEFLALAWIFVPSTLVAIIPTPDTFSRLASLASSAQTIIIEEQAPIAAAKPIVLVVASSFGLMVIVADLLLERRHAAQMIGVLFLAVFATPAMISGTMPSVWLFVPVAALWLVILRSRTALGGVLGRRQRGPAAVLGAIALVGAALFPTVSPDISAVATSWGKPPPAVFGRGINPMLELGQNLRRNTPVTALTYKTTLNTAPYLKVATLRSFTGKTWRPVESNGDERFEGQIGLHDDIKTDEALTTITVRQLRSTMLPVPYPALTVSGLEGSWRWERLGMTLRANDDDDSRGQKYSVTSLELEPTNDQMRELTTVVGPSLRPYVRLPEDIPTAISDTAHEVTADAPTDWEKAQALQTYLRNGDFTYSETAPVADGYDGNGVDVIAKFLEEKSGYCVHFSSAMAVMARTLGIPSRIAVGYAPGETVRVERGQNVYEVTSDNLHAWPELYFEGVGWVQFEPTPGVGRATSFAAPGSPSSDSDSSNTTGTDRSQQNNQRQGLDSGAPTSSTSSDTAPRTAIATLAGLVVLVASPSLLRWARRRWRLRRGRTSPDPLWRELEDTARDFGVQTSAADTPRGFVGRLQERPGVEDEALYRLLHRVETARFARSGAPEGDGVEDLRTIVDSIRDGATRRQRLRAAVLPRSLAGSRTYVVPREVSIAGPLAPES
jgi:transglutaminase-like putative cysteine protease